MRRFVADFLLLFAAAVRGLAFYFQKTAMSEIGPFLFIAARSLLASCALAPVAFVELRRRARGREGAVDLAGLIRLGMLGGVVFFLGAALQQMGLVTATVTDAGFLTGLYVVITPFIVWLISRQPPSPVVWTAVAMAFTGTWALGGGTVGGLSRGDVLIAICAALGDPHRRDEPVAAFRHADGVHLLPIRHRRDAWRNRGPAFRADLGRRAARASRSILYVGLLSSALTFTLLAIALKHTPAPEAAVLVSMETVFAAIAGAVLLGERLTPMGWFGAGLLFAASLLVQLSPRAKTIAQAA